LAVPAELREDYFLTGLMGMMFEELLLLNSVIMEGLIIRLFYFVIGAVWAGVDCVEHIVE